MCLCRDFFYYYYLFMSCLLFMASEKQSQNTAEAEEKLWARLFGGAKAAGLQTRRGRECLSATKCLFFVSRRWHLPDSGMRREGEEPAGFHLGQSLVPHWLAGMLRKLHFSKKLGSEAQHPKKDQPASDWGHQTTYSLCHLLHSFPAQPFPCWGAAFPLLQVSSVTPRSCFWGPPNSAAIPPKHKCSCSSWDAAKDPERARPP